ncbi:MAG: hypothetical protein J5791_07265 [Fibrobacter sp.]|nr:hypothetical protein [Fibrobacter sp.]
MKKILVLLVLITCSCSDERSSSSPEETIPPYTPRFGTLYDARDGHSYKTTFINGLEWMAENLNYYVQTTECVSCSGELVTCGEQDSLFQTVPSGIGYCFGISTYVNSGCYNDSPENCEKYGRMYSWDAAVGDTLKIEWRDALGLGDSIQGICPDGWRLPTETDFYERLWYFLCDRHPELYMRDRERKLRSTEGWPDSLKGTDEYGFNLLAGGFGRDKKIGECASFWLANELNQNLSLNVNFDCLWNGGLVSESNKSVFRYVRCVREYQ